jgi:hypothetical protein
MTHDGAPDHGEAASRRWLKRRRNRRWNRRWSRHRDEEAAIARLLDGDPALAALLAAAAVPGALDPGREEAAVAAFRAAGARGPGGAPRSARAAGAAALAVICAAGGVAVAAVLCGLPATRTTLPHTPARVRTASARPADSTTSRPPAVAPGAARHVITGSLPAKDPCARCSAPTTTPASGADPTTGTGTDSTTGTTTGTRQPATPDPTHVRAHPSESPRPLTTATPATVAASDTPTAAHPTHHRDRHHHLTHRPRTTRP